ncbi:cyclic nucleotide-binding/CBS domain-containing protein [Nocardioides aestuarii]|uniref:Nucleotidyltransferase substrate binding domain-containing protein n=1 Tax=Nocardioides aestuarii TaxID=252231 RepID=A0ABW4TG42_9ACTN
MALDVELAEIRDFLASHPPFDHVPVEELTPLLSRLSIDYRRRGSLVLAGGSEVSELLVVRSGAVELRDAADRLVERGGAGTTVGGEALVTGAPQSGDVTAIEDTLLLVVPADVLATLRGAHPALTTWFASQAGSLLRQAVARPAPGTTGSTGEVLRTRVGDLVGRPPVTVGRDTTVRDAARLMDRERISSVLVTDGPRLVGILTDRDLRSRVVARARELTTPVSEVMTPDPVTGSPDQLALEVLLELVRRNIHHLPLVDGGVPVAMVTSTDLLRLEQADPVHLVGEVAKAADTEAVAAVARRLERVVAGLVRQGTSAHDTGRVVTSVGDAVERRLIELAEAELGPAPVPWAWLTLGSRARFEQALGGDQDHALVLADDAVRDGGVDPHVAAWFAALAERVTAGLETAGYPRCRGDKMATNPQWRAPLAAWLDHVDRWVSAPAPAAVLDASVFFDLRHLAGDPDLTATLRDHQVRAARGSSLFLAHLAGAAATRNVPVGFFRNLVVERSGDHRDTLDLKRGGLLPLVEVARLHALAAGSAETATLARLDDAVADGRLSAPLGADLRDAWEFLSLLRLRHQAGEVAAGRAPDNHVAPSGLSSFEQRHLRSAFGVIRQAQSALAQRYPVRAVT